MKECGPSVEGGIFWNLKKKHLYQLRKQTRISSNMKLTPCYYICNAICFYSVYIYNSLYLYHFYRSSMLSDMHNGHRFHNAKVTIQHKVLAVLLFAIVLV